MRRRKPASAGRTSSPKASETAVSADEGAAVPSFDMRNDERRRPWLCCERLRSRLQRVPQLEELRELARSTVGGDVTASSKGLFNDSSARAARAFKIDQRA